MDSVPGTPDPQTRSAVTQRIIAHVTAAGPASASPSCAIAGQFCYVSAVLPGHREPTPILASTGQYTESELPASFGPTTGTPEQGVDDTFILYAGPKSDR